jgi:hypothetical protein
MNTVGQFMNWRLHVPQRFCGRKRKTLPRRRARVQRIGARGGVTRKDINGRRTEVVGEVPRTELYKYVRRLVIGCEVETFTWATSRLPRWIH